MLRIAPVVLRKVHAVDKRRDFSSSPDVAMAAGVGPDLARPGSELCRLDGLRPTPRIVDRHPHLTSTTRILAAALRTRTMQWLLAAVLAARLVLEVAATILRSLSNADDGPARRAGRVGGQGNADLCGRVACLAPSVQNALARSSR